MIKKKCLICEKSFQVHPCRHAAKYCSRACQHIGWGKRNKGNNHPMWKGGKIPRNCEKCGKAFHTWPYMIKEGKGNFCSKSCGASRSGDKNNFWKGGRYITPMGYVMLYKPDHPNRNTKGYVREHRYIMEQFIGRILVKHEVIHHINGIKDDNRIENLKLFTNHSEHIKHHLHQP